MGTLKITQNYVKMITILCSKSLPSCTRVNLFSLNYVLTLCSWTFQIVPPDGNTTFDVVFLARQEGNVENTLYIHTSLGSFKYQVSIQCSIYRATERYFCKRPLSLCWAAVKQFMFCQFLLYSRCIFMGGKISGLYLNSGFWGWLSKESQPQNPELSRF